ncbi:hypothetical protein N802_05820 [Knoellia sinensis KCTC 19936]|uniref:Uncharacterized protein n=1 Tax=Knoellia sinensis KCTC 19936 TaxID=1385520 RepID=A0A0A0J2K5_9MICO|nr:hypothetical protein [Knoellia sinensis]KGN30914.1 hypothetical protein N802_05820 [Knoellia sinensis KCTC 19936]
MASSLSASWTCQECKKRRRGAKHTTMTGRTICGSCQRGLDAVALGVMTGADTGSAMGNAVGIHGIREMLRRRLGKKD